MTIECSVCGADNRTRAVFCFVCGAHLRKPFDKEESLLKSTLHTLKQGTLLSGRFNVIDLINTGGMGYIYKGEDLLLKRPVAVKEMIDRFTDPKERTEAIERFRREAEMLCSLDHEAIPKFFEYFFDNQRYYLVMDFIEGIDLRKVIKRMDEAHRKVPIDKIIQWAIEICNVLEYLHSQNPPIVYRDLKPSNIMITLEGSIKLIDFGIARLFVSSEKATMVGTQGYAPPEQYRGQADPRSDIYSLGATLHHLITGKDPQCEAPFHFEQIRKISPDIPVSLELMIEKSLRLVPADRYQSAEELKQQLTNIVSHEDVFSNLNNEIKSIESEISNLRRKKTKILEPKRSDNSFGEGLSTKAFVQEYPVDWKIFRGNRQRTGQSGVTANLKGALVKKIHPCQKAITSPIVDENGRIFIGSADMSLYCFEPHGEKIWTFTTKGAVLASIALDEKNCAYLPSDDGILYCLDKKGKEKWQYVTRGSIKSSPLIWEDLIYFGSSDGVFYCINNKGKHQWHYYLEAPIMSSAAAAPNGIIVIGTSGGEIVSFKNGKPIWRASLPKMINSTPAISDEGLIAVTCEDGFLYALDLNGDLLWKHKTDGWINASPAIGKDGSVYFGSSDCRFYCVSNEGIEKWRFLAESIITSSAAISDEGNIYFASSKGMIYCLNSWGKSKWWFNLGERVSTSPAIGPTRYLYVSSEEGRLFIIG